MSKNKQSSVKWLVEHFGGIENCTPDFRMKIEQAKAMHKEEIEEAYKNGWDVGDFGSDCWEEIYYNETYGGNDGKALDN